jgi:hypothetical protein
MSLASKLRLAVLAAGCLVFVAGCENKVTKDNYDQIEVGMTEAQVEAILGEGEDTVDAEAGIPDASFKMKTWTHGNSSIVIMFQDGKVATKARAGL